MEIAMPLLFARMFIAGLLAVCLSSFGWGMRHFFICPNPSTPGMKLTGCLGAAFALLHLGGIAWCPDLSLARAALAAAGYTAACGLFWWAVSANRTHPLPACFSPAAQVYFTRYGPYRIIRHPFYCSYLITWFTGLAVTCNMWLAPTAIVMLALYATAARCEERQFTGGPLAKAYREYCARTGQFLPNPRKILLTLCEGASEEETG
jgi:protein-S-isoprenylcysteine O-methyltransferase Ste14